MYAAVLRWFVLFACACAPGEFDSPRRYDSLAALPLGSCWKDLLPLLWWLLRLGGWRWAYFGDFLRRCCGWCRSSSPCWGGGPGAVGFHSMGKLRFRCCRCHRRLAGFGGVLNLIFYPTWLYVGPVAISRGSVRRRCLRCRSTPEWAIMLFD